MGARFNPKSVMSMARRTRARRGRSASGAVRISKAKQSIASAEMTQVYARLNAGRYLIEANKRLHEFDADTDFEAWCLANVRLSMPDCNECMWLGFVTADRQEPR